MVQTKASGGCTCFDHQYYLVWCWLRDEMPDGLAEWEARGAVTQDLARQLTEDGFELLLPLDPDVVWTACRQFFKERVNG